MKDIKTMPYSLRVLLESLKRQGGSEEHINNLLENRVGEEIPFLPSRVILQDFTGVPAIVDLAAMRDAVKNPSRVNPQLPVDLVIDHSVQVDSFGSEDSLSENAKFEFERNEERYKFLKWAEQSFDNFKIVPPATGIIHQVNIEYLSDVVIERDGKIFPDSVYGTDSHTTMVNALGVLGWGVGGIEAEAAMLGQPSSLTVPEVIGVRLLGKMQHPATATDLALTVTKLLRDENVVGKFVEFFGEGMEKLSLADRATVANMAPEYGATCGFFPIDNETINYLRMTNRDEKIIQRVIEYTKANNFFYDGNTEPEYTKVLELDLSSITPRLSGPSRPQDTVELGDMKDNFRNFVEGKRPIKEEDGKIAVAAITSCTNTSNPYVMIMAGLVAKRAVEKGLSVPSYVKTSLAPGSKVVTSYLEDSGLMPYLNKLGFNVVGYGCTTCIGNSGGISEELERELSEKDTVIASVLSGNRNFEGRIHPLVKANYLASPPLVVAYAILGNLQKDIMSLKDLFPTHEEVEEMVQKFVTKESFAQSYKTVFNANETWNAIETTPSEVYDWPETSTYISKPPYFDEEADKNLENLQVLCKLGDSITTDHISPAGIIGKNSPAGKYLISQGVQPQDFNSYGARRGNDKVMVRGTFANNRIRNQLCEGTEGGFTRYKGEVVPIYDAAMGYKEEGTGLVILAGKDYGMGSSRDWAAKGTKLLGVKAVIAESFERIHRSNLAMMGVLPLQFMAGENANSLGLTGEETYKIELPEEPKINEVIRVWANNKVFNVVLRFDSLIDIEYYKNDGIMPYVTRRLDA